MKQEEFQKKPRRARPEIYQLETFLAVAQARSFTGAARLLGRPQPAVSQTIARLESIFGGDLFVRPRGRQLELTPIGRTIEPYAIDLLSTVDLQLRRAIETAQSRTGRLVVGFYPGIGAGPLRDALRQFRIESPEVELSFVEGLPGQLYRQLNERSIDIMIATFMPNGTSTNIERSPLWEERLFVAVTSADQLAKCSDLAWADIAHRNIILRTWQGENSPYHAILSRIRADDIDCEQHAVSRDALLAMVAIGIGCTIVFASAVTNMPGLSFVPIRGASSTSLIEAFWPMADSNPLRHRMVGHLRQQSLLHHGRTFKASARPQEN
jgi:LysR family hydrogen peroxide-inducible transcriptional activator